jgi:OOP family OmpA-OmpF porin
MQTNIAGTSARINGVKASGWNLAGVGTLPLSREFSLFGKLGWAWNHSDGGTATDPVTGISVSVGSNSRSYGMVGVGANFAFTKNWAARLEYEDFGRVTSDDVWGTGSSGAVKASAWSLSAKYSF